MNVFVTLFNYLLSVYLLNVCVLINAAIFPKELERCKKDDAEIDVCLKNAIQNSLPVLAKGIRKVDLVPIEPLVTRSVKFYHDLGVVKLDMTFTNLSTYGYSSAQINRVKSDVENYKLKIYALFPKITIHGDYLLKGNILRLPLEGGGSFIFTLDNVNATLHVVGVKETRSGVNFLKIRDMPVSMAPEKITFDLRNLFNGNKALGTYANNFVNRFSTFIYKEVRSTAEPTVGAVFKEVAQRFYKKVPYDEIFL